MYNGKSKIKRRKHTIAWLKMVDWKEWKEEFLSEIHPDGTYKHRSINAFALEKAEGDKLKKSLIYGSIGKKPTPGVPWQGDWTVERFSRKFGDDQKVKALEERIDQEMDMFQRASITAEGIRPWLQRVKEMASELDEFTGGKATLDPPLAFGNMTKKMQRSWERKMKRRYKWVLGMITRLAKLDAGLRTAYVKTLTMGGKPQVVALLAQYAGLVVEGGRRGDSYTLREQKALPGAGDPGRNPLMAQLLTDVARKAAIYDVPLPDDLEELKGQVIDVEAEELEGDVVKTKKRKNGKE